MFVGSNSNFCEERRNHRTRYSSVLIYLLQRQQISGFCLEDDVNQCPNLLAPFVQKLIINLICRSIKQIYSFNESTIFMNIPTIMIFNYCFTVIHKVVKYIMSRFVIFAFEI